MITSPVAQYNKTIKYEAKNREAVKSKDIDFDTITRDARNWQNFYGLVPARQSKKANFIFMRMSG